MIYSPSNHLGVAYDFSLSDEYNSGVNHLDQWWKFTKETWFWNLFNSYGAIKWLITAIFFIAELIHNNQLREIKQGVQTNKINIQVCIHQIM